MCLCVAGALQDDHVAESLRCVSVVADVLWDDHVAESLLSVSVVAEVLQDDHVAESLLCVSLCGRCTSWCPGLGCSFIRRTTAL